MKMAFDAWLRDIVKNNDHSFVRDAEEIIAACEERAKGSPEKYGWRFSDVESFEKQAKKVRTPTEANAMLWTDQARNAEAYGLMSFWRACELIENAVITLNRKDLVASAVLARSAIELAATFIVNASGAAPLSYQWLRNGVEIPGASTSSYTVPFVMMSDNGVRFTVRVWNGNGQMLSSPATLSVQTLVQKGRQKTTASVSTKKVARARR
jgi:hypothetical protein